MNITVTISAPELANAIQTLAQALSTGSTAEVIPFKVPTESATDKKEKPTAERKAAKEEAKEGGAEEQIVSLETVRAKLAALSKSGKQTEVKALIASFDASKLTNIPAERYGELLAKAEAIE
ncbi:hypothetical protein [Brevibacillus laterosporus]|uniref:rRNA biogenesis protein rrp5 n=1 Tax=Brevibacillus laterosporus TaxID=1465 RepID=A0AAP8QH46_BRELA|nr:hypothetical protein [Brevibacillus laterosporus]PPB10880.1 hypothetical protein C4A77_04445 [Brevibacillus laterosporus]